nr:esterase [uncultured bacterium]
MLCAASAHADNHGAASDLHWSVLMEHTYRVEPDITYLIADGYESKLDVIAPRDTAQKLPTLIYIHGGGWVGGTKERSTLHYLRYLQMGFAVVNVEYRMARDALAPAAVEDTRCALRWVINNADQYGLDANRIVVSGHSAGGHLSLTTGMLPASARFDRRCPRRNPLGAVADADFPEMKVAAIVNWFGITDVADLVEGDNAKTYAVAWLGGMRDWKLVAKEVSPLTYVRRGLPPIITIHGNADTIVPYDHAVRLHKQLNRRKVANQLITIEGGGHGGFPLDEHVAAMEQVRSFLQANGVLK